MVYKGRAHSLFSLPRHTPSLLLLMFSSHPNPPHPVAINWSRAHPDDILAGWVSLHAAQMLGDSRAGLRRKPRGAGRGHDPGCRAGLAAISEAGEEAEGPGCRCPGWGAQGLCPPRPAPQCLGRFPFWLEDCSLQSPRSSATGLPLRYKPTRVFTPETRAATPKANAPNQKVLGTCPAKSSAVV